MNLLVANEQNNEEVEEVIIVTKWGEKIAPAGEVVDLLDVI